MTKQALWKERINLCKRSGKNVKDWCSDNQVSKHAYYYWHRKLEHLKEDLIESKPVFVEVSTQLPAEPQSSEISITWKDFTIKVSNEHSIEMATKLLNKLGEQVC